MACQTLDAQVHQASAPLLNRPYAGSICLRTVQVNNRELLLAPAAKGSTIRMPTCGSGVLKIKIGPACSG